MGILNNFFTGLFYETSFNMPRTVALITSCKLVELTNFFSIKCWITCKCDHCSCVKVKKLESDKKILIFCAVPSRIGNRYVSIFLSRFPLMKSAYWNLSNNESWSSDKQVFHFPIFYDVWCENLKGLCMYLLLFIRNSFRLLNSVLYIWELHLVIYYSREIFVWRVGYFIVYSTREAQILPATCFLNDAVAKREREGCADPAT